MNQELKQRLIAAVVVTALAAIFIPMLFDDPVDNSGQLVSELVIPTTSVKTDEVSANKLSTSANQVLNAPDAGAETVVNTKEEAELSANKQLPSDKTFTEEGIDQSADEPTNDSSFTSLETGVVDQTNKPVKTKNTIQEAEPSKQKSTPKPHLEADTVVAVPKKPAKKTERSTTTQAKKVTKPQPKEATAKVTKPQPKEATAKVTKPQPKGTLTKNTKLSVDEKITTPDKNNSATQYYRYPTTPN
jgi:DedD protein